MKIKVDSGPPYEPGTVYLHLVETDPNHVMLEAVYDYSSDLPEDDAVCLPGGGLLTITEGGMVSLSPRVDPDLGFDLDHDGRLKLDPYAESMTARRGHFRGKRANLTIDNTLAPIGNTTSPAPSATFPAPLEKPITPE